MLGKSIMKTFILRFSHVTCSKLKTNCTNPSYRVLQFPFMSSRSGFLPRTDYYSVLFPLFRMSSLRDAKFKFAFFFFPFHHYFIISFFPLADFISGWPRKSQTDSRCCVLNSVFFFLIFFEDIDVLFSSLLFSFEWVFKIVLFLRSRIRSSKETKLMKKWWVKLATSH